MTERAVIYGFEGLTLNEAEKSFFREVNPWGYIVFARNIEAPVQLLSLTDELRELSGRNNVPILIDQEGGRVARLRGPQWRDAPPNAVFGEAWARDPETAREATWLNSRLLAHELKANGINVDCVPMLDIKVPGSNDVVIGDRVYSEDPEIVSILGRASAEGVLAFCRSSNICPDMAAPASTVTTDYLLLMQRLRSWRKPISFPFGRSMTCRSA